MRHFSLRPLAALASLWQMGCAFFIHPEPPTPAQIRAAFPPETSYDVLHYEAKLLVNPPFLISSTTITLSPLVPSPVVELTSHHGHPFFVKRGPNNAHYFENRNKIFISLDGATPGKNEEISFFFLNNTDAMYSAHALVSVHGTRFFGLGGWNWMPCGERPGDKATLSLELSTTHSFSSFVGPGRLVEQAAKGKHGASYRFSVDTPTPCYLYGFAQGIFEREVQKGPQDRVELEYISEEKPETISVIFSETRLALGFFEERTGVPYPFERYTQVFLNEAPSLEMVGFSVLPTSYTRELANDPREDWRLAYELAHQWWGTTITSEGWSDFWLNNAFAAFMADAYKEERWGRDEYDREVILARKRYKKLREQGKDHPLRLPPETTEKQVEDPLPDSKGSLVLHLLRAEVGEDAFWAAVREYSSSNAGKTVTSDTLRESMERASGKDLRLFFQQWITQAEVPDIKVHHQQEGDFLRIEITQKQPTLWELPLWLAVETETGRQRYRVVLRQQQHQLRLPISGALRSVRVDDGGFLPFTPEHERSSEMLRWQMAHEPDAAGRVDALEQLSARCRKPSTDPVCSELPKELKSQVAQDKARVVQAAAEECLKEFLRGD